MGLLLLYVVLLLVIVSLLNNKPQEITEHVPVTKEVMNAEKEHRKNNYSLVRNLKIRIFLLYNMEIDNIEEIIELLRILYNYEDTGDFLEKHPEIHDYILGHNDKKLCKNYSFS